MKRFASSSTGDGGDASSGEDEAPCVVCGGRRTARETATKPPKRE
ncbi:MULTISPECIES: hypothetical protein [Aeribacillus]|nr:MULTISPECIES: hypothetical protein [Aeribacillus]MDR9792053.1 hypothetical protein [Aeribacillus pallidus]MED1438194.1 hypothetical protein [Aeribacillus composti]